MTEKTPTGRRGLFESLTALTATLVAVAYTRLDMLSTDLEEDREHLLSLLLLSLTALFCLGVGVVLAIILLVVACGDAYRLQVLGSLAGVFLIVSFAMWRFTVHKVKTKPKLFSASLSELYKDHQQLDTDS